MSSLVSILIILLVVAICFWIFVTYVMPIIPAPWGKVILAVAALIVIIFLLDRFLL